MTVAMVSWDDLVARYKFHQQFESLGKNAQGYPLDVDGSYVSRIIRLCLLAPDIVEAIVEGREPSGLSLERLVGGLPVVWEEQREKLWLDGATAELVR